MHCRALFAFLACAATFTRGLSVAKNDALNNCSHHPARPVTTAIKGHGLTALVAGGAGFVGSHVAKACLKLGFARVIVADDLSSGYKHNVPEEAQFLHGDLKDSNFVKILLLKTKPHVVYYLATEKCNRESPAFRQGSSSASACANLFYAGVDVGFMQRFVFVSSAITHGNSSQPDQVQSLHEVSTSEVATEVAEETDLAAEWATPAVSSFALKLNSVYGPGMDLNSRSSEVARVMTHLKEKMAKKPANKVDGRSVLAQPLSYVTDISHAIALGGLLPEAANQTFNVGSSATTTTLSDLERACREAWEDASKAVPHRAEFNIPSRHTLQPQHHFLSNVSSQIRQDLDQKSAGAYSYSHEEFQCYFERLLPSPKPLDEGLKHTATWLQQHLRTDSITLNNTTSLLPTSNAATQSAQDLSKIGSLSGSTSSWGLNRDEVGFFLQVFKEKENYLAQMLSGVRYFYPRSPIFLISDHGDNYGALCAVYGCAFIMEPSTLNTDLGRPPHTFTCEKFIGRMLRAIDASGTEVRYFYYWESDVRAIGPLRHAPSSDLMQMFSEHNRWRAEIKAKMDALFLHTRGKLLGWSSAGGTLFDARKLANALHAQTLPIFYKSEKWQAMRSFWLSDRGKYLVQDQSSDSCLAGTVLVAGMTIGKWFEYGEIKRMNHDLRAEPWYMKNSGDMCNRCIRACQEQHPNSTVSWSWKLDNLKESRINLDARSISQPPLRYPPPPALDLCIFQQCGEKALCPSVVHDMKITWSEYEPAKGWPGPQ